jgi:hypothetical protein
MPDTHASLMQEWNLTHLDSARKLRLADELVASVPDEDLSIHPGVLAELRRRHAAYEQDPCIEVPAEQAHARLQERVDAWQRK